jgi:hypothetical protein
MKTNMLCVGAVLLACTLQSAAATSLRATPTKPAAAAAKPAPTATESAQDLQKLAPALGDKVADTVAKALAASSSKVAEKTQEQPAAKPVQHQKLDVGFQDFEKSLTDAISAKLLQTATGTAWNDDMRAKLTKNVTDVLKGNMKEILKPVKQSIGKTWMALPQDEQKDEYVNTLKKSFHSVFENSEKTVLSHLDLSLKRLDGYTKDKSLSQSQLLEKSEFSVDDSLTTEHCYDVLAKKSSKDMKAPANKTEVPAEKKKFCIQSVIGALAPSE